MAKDEKTLQEKYLNFQVIEQQIKQVSQQVQELNNKLMELEYIKMSLDELGEVKQGSEILAPISSGVFIKTELKNNKELMVNVGSSTVVTKNIAETKNLMDDQIREIESMREKLVAQLQELTVKAQSLEQELSKLIKEG